MNSLAELLPFLSIDHHPDSWAESSEAVARATVERFGDAEWQALAAAWRTLPVPAQVRLVDVLYALKARPRFQILEAMVLHAEPMARDAAIEGLELNGPEYRPPPEIVDFLTRLRPTLTEEPVRRTIDLLLRTFATA